MKMYKRQRKNKKGRIFALLLALMLAMAPAFGSYASTSEDEQTSGQALGDEESDTKKSEIDEDETSEDVGEKPEKTSVESGEETEELGAISEEPKAGETGEIRFYTVGEGGGYWCDGSMRKNDVKKGQTLKEAGITLPEPPSNYLGLQFVGWMDVQGNEITEDSQIVFEKEYFVGAPTLPAGEYYFMRIYAKYDKGVQGIRYTYPSSDGEWLTGGKTVPFEYGWTYADLVNSLQDFKPEDMTDEYEFSGWKLEQYRGIKETDTIPNNVVDNLGMEITAKFKDTTLLEVDYNYITQEGRDANLTQRGREVFSVEEGTSVGEVVKMLQAAEPPKTYKGLRFKNWEVGNRGLDENAVVEHGDMFFLEANYENCLVRYFIHDSGYKKEEVFGQVAEKGETITTLTTFGDWKDITWVNSWPYNGVPDKTIAVNENMDFMGTGISGSTESGNQSNSGNTTKPSNSSSGSSSNGATGSTADKEDNPYVTPESKLPDSVVISAVEAVNAAASGQTIRINMNTSTTVSKEILEAARGKDINVTLEMDGYSWTINGRNIQSTNLQDINLQVIKNTDHITSSTIRSLAGNNPYMQITLVHEGNFGFQATLNIGVGAEYSGKYGNLYYHDSAGKMVFMNAGRIDSNGYVSLSFSHASDYLLVMSDAMMSQTNVPSQLMPSSPEQSQSGEVSSVSANTNSVKSVKTGDNDMLYPWMLLCITAAGIMITIYQFKKKQA